MSMPRIERSENPVDREQSINDLVESIALMETGLSHVINAEGEKIQKIIKYNEDVDVPIDDILSANDSAQKMLNTVSKLEMILQNKLDIAKEFEPAGVMPIEMSGALIPYSGNVTVSSLANGTPDEATLMSFQYGYQLQPIDLNGNPDEITLNSSYSSFSIARDGIITSLSAFFEGASQAMHQDIQVIARLYKAERDSDVYYPIDGAIVQLTPIIPAGSTEYARVSGAAENINATVQINEKIILLFYIESSATASFTGYAGGSVNIQ